MVVGERDAHAGPVRDDEDFVEVVLGVSSEEGTRQEVQPICAKTRRSLRDKTQFSE
jgi:hypothetical protein